MKENNMKIILHSLLITTFLCSAAPSYETAMEYQKNEQFTDAITCYEEITLHESHNANAWFNLGHCYLALGQGERAINAFNNVLRINPQALPAHYNKAFTYKTIGDLDAAIDLYKQIIETNPDYEPAHIALGFAYLTQGDFENGWKQHGRYLVRSGKNGDTLRKLLQNNTIGYKKILLCPEGGLGDTLLFIRYAERLKEMHTDVIVACQKPLIPLLSRCPYIDQLIPCGTPTPEHHASATLMSLPAIFNDNETTAPHKIPYLFADPALIDYWKEQLAHDTNFKVGICWQVDVHNDESRLPIARRGFPLNSFAPLGNIDGVSFYSLQKFDGIEELATLSSDFNLQIFDGIDEKSGPFMDTAAIIKNLDLVITVDTAIAHLAGGLGTNVWIVHPYATADWRWICHKTDSYWYPNVRIFKQQKPFDVDTVMQEVHAALQQLVHKK